MEQEEVNETDDNTDQEEPKSENKSDRNEETQTQIKYDPKNVRYEGEEAIYTDTASGYEYTWNKEEEKWTLRSKVTYGFEDDTHTYTDSDGAKYFWDKEKKAWFPKIDDDFMAVYQMNYGVDVTKQDQDPENAKEAETPKSEIEETSAEENKKLKRKPPSEPTWFDVDDAHNTNVYVSNLPTDITEQEFTEFMQKAGMIMQEPKSDKLKIKLYKDAGTGDLKGDGLCTYIKIESIDLALKVLDGAYLKGKTVKVERAKFQMKGEFDPKLKPKKRRKKEVEKLKKMQQKLFDWRPERMRGERAKHERVVIVKNVFDPAAFDDDVGLILEYQQDLREEASKCGEVKKVTIFDRHPQGVAQINMRSPEEADQVVQLLNGRWFGKRKLTAEIYDGKTKFRIAETESEISQRLDKWNEFLDTDDNSKVKSVKDE